MLVAIDLETTGLIAGHHEIISVGCIAINEDFSVVDTFHVKSRPLYINRLTPEASEVNGYYTFDESFIPSMEARELLCIWLSNIAQIESKKLIVIAQNWGFDLGFLNMWDENRFKIYLARDYIDTKSISLFLMKAKIIPQMSTSLGIIANYFGIPEPGKHTSLGDAQCTIRVYQAQLNLLKNK